MSRGATEENKRIFDGLLKHREAVESKMGGELEWQRLDNKKACRIKFETPVYGFDEENWPEMRDWQYTHMMKLEAAIREPLSSVAKAALGR
jgi:hypothetical protein